MSIFSGTYANNYDLFYQSKDYLKEASFVFDLAKESGNSPQNLLDLGSGTGKHAIEWASLGLTVKGLERSPEMIASAAKNLAQYPEYKEKIRFEQADISNFSAEENSYDIVTAMFAVLGYITGTDDLLNCFSSISFALKSGGLFICDTWHGPAVLSEKPSNRTHKFETPEGTIYRIVQSDLKAIEQVVQVDYSIICINETKNVYEESHNMRFFFQEEMKLFAKLSGMELINSCPFLGKGHISEKDWNVNWVFRKL